MRRHLAPDIVVLGAFMALACTAPAAAQQPGPLDQVLAQRVSRTFVQTSLPLVVESLQRGTRLNLVVDPTLTGSQLVVNLEVRDEPLGSVLDRVVGELRLARTVWCGAVYVHAPDAPPGPSTGPRLPRVVSVAYEAEPAAEAFDRLGVRAAQAITITPRARAFLTNEGTRLTLRLWDVRLDQALTLAARLCRLTWRLDGMTVILDAADGAGRDVADQQIHMGTGSRPEDLVVGLDPIEDLVVLLTQPTNRTHGIQRLVMRGGDAVPPVAALLARPETDSPTATACLRVLAQVADARGASAALAIFRDAQRSLEVRAEAAQALGAMRAPDAIPVLIAALDDPWFKISETARTALVEIGMPAVEPLLARYRQALASTQGDGAVYRSLLIFGGIRGADGKVDPRCRDALLEALGVTQGLRALALRHHAAIGLGRTHDPQVIEPLIEALERETGRRGTPIVARYIGRALTEITEVELPPLPSRWRVWWGQNRDRLLPAAASSRADLELQLPIDPETGLPTLE